jgi:hypothetical protein
MVKSSRVECRFETPFADLHIQVHGERGDRALDFSFA